MQKIDKNKPPNTLNTQKTKHEALVKDKQHLSFAVQYLAKQPTTSNEQPPCKKLKKVYHPTCASLRNIF
jgi:hypothetical protein